MVNGTYVDNGLGPLEDIECEENWDCCTCDYISCGDPLTSSWCDKFVVGGDHGAFGVKGIAIYGDPDDGATIECGGDSSCEGTFLTGVGVSDIKCGGDRACHLAFNWDVTCLLDEPCTMECTGDESMCAPFVMHETEGVFLFLTVNNQAVRATAPRALEAGSPSTTAPGSSVQARTRAASPSSSW